MKKQYWLLVLLLAALLCCPAASGAESMAELYPSLSQGSGMAGDEITLYLYLTADNVGGLQTNLTWNTGYLTYVEGSAAFSADFAEKALVSLINDEEDGKIRLAYGNTEGYNGSWSEIFSARFVLNEDVVGGTSFELKNTKLTDATPEVNTIPVNTGSAYIYTEVYNAGNVDLYPGISNSEPLIGDKLTVNLYASASDTLGSVQGRLVYDPKVLAYVEGSAALNQAYADSAVASMINDETPGEISFVYASTTGCNEYHFATAEFEVIGGVNGSYYLDVRDVKATNASTEHLALMNAYGGSAWFNVRPIPHVVYYTLYSAQTEALCGSTINVAIQADGPALGGMQATLTYDAEQLTYVEGSAAFTDEFAEEATISLINDGTVGQIKLVYAHAEGFDPEKSDIFTAQFVAKQPSVDSLQLTGVKTTDAATEVPTILECEAQIGQMPMMMHDEVVDAEVPPTCTTDGLFQGWHCAVCGYVTQPQEVWPAFGHYEEYIYPVEPNCTENGWTDGWRCMTCGEILTAPQEVPAWGHSEMHYEEIPATCTMDGTTAWSYCMTCGETLVWPETIPAYGHSETHYAEIPATCTTDGTTAWSSCTTCGETLVWPETIPAFGHSEVYCEGMPATCISDGTAAWSYCMTCNETLVQPETIPAYGHNETHYAEIPATCTTDGTTAWSSCTTCGETLVWPETIPAFGHMETHYAEIPATCTTDGTTAWSTCMTCGETLVQPETILAFGHMETYYAEIPATCTTDGTTAWSSCTTCGETLVGPETIPASGHMEMQYDEIPATCTTDGQTTWSSCMTCGDTVIWPEVIPALDHTEVIDQAVAPTCTATGLTEGKHCKVCSAVLVKQETVAALGHTEVIDGKIPATHMTTGLTEGKHCGTCGKLLAAQQAIPMVKIDPVILSAALLSIDEAAFEGSGIECINIPEKCRTIAGRAFAGCKTLRFIYIPASVTSIADDAFDGSNAELIIVTTAGSQAEIFAQEHNIVYVLKK